MPTENLIVVIAILTVFTVFGVVLAYVNRIAGRRPPSQGAAAE